MVCYNIATLTTSSLQLLSSYIAIFCVVCCECYGVLQYCNTHTTSSLQLHTLTSPLLSLCCCNGVTMPILFVLPSPNTTLPYFALQVLRCGTIMLDPPNTFQLQLPLLPSLMQFNPLETSETHTTNAMHLSWWCRNTLLL